MKGETAPLRKSSPFTSFSLTFGKLAKKFEFLCKRTNSPLFQNFGGGDERVRVQVRVRRMRRGAGDVRVAREGWRAVRGGCDRNGG